MTRKGIVYVADRGNSRIVVLDNDLNQKAVYDNVGAPWAVCISQGPHQYLYSSNSFPTGNNFDQAPTTGEIYKMELDGTVLGRFGKAGTRVQGVQQRPPDGLPQPGRDSTWRRSPRGARRRSSCTRRRRARAADDRRPCHEAHTLLFLGDRLRRSHSARRSVAQSVPEINFDANADI